MIWSSIDIDNVFAKGVEHIQEVTDDTAGKLVAHTRITSKIAELRASIVEEKHRGETEKMEKNHQEEVAKVQELPEKGQDIEESQRVTVSMPEPAKHREETEKIEENPQQEFAKSSEELPEKGQDIENSQRITVSMPEDAGDSAQVAPLDFRIEVSDVDAQEDLRIEAAKGAAPEANTESDAVDEVGDFLFRRWRCDRDQWIDDIADMGSIRSDNRVIIAPYEAIDNTMKRSRNVVCKLVAVT